MIRLPDKKNERPRPLIYARTSVLSAAARTRQVLGQDRAGGARTALPAADRGALSVSGDGNATSCRRGQVNRLGVDVGVGHEEDVVAVGEVEEGDAGGGETEDEGCDERICDGWVC